MIKIDQRESRESRHPFSKNERSAITFLWSINKSIFKTQTQITVLVNLPNLRFRIISKRLSTMRSGVCKKETIFEMLKKLLISRNHHLSEHIRVVYRKIKSYKTGEAKSCHNFRCYGAPTSTNFLHRFSCKQGGYNS